MPHAARRAIAAALLLSALTGCSGPREVTPAQSSSTVTQRSTPPPSGGGCADAGDLSALADEGFIDALKAMPATTKFAQYATLDPTREKKLNALDGVTAFVPVDSAWTRLDPTTAQQLADPAWQGAAVEYALVPKVYLPEDFAGEATAAMQTFRGVGAVLSGTSAAGGILLNGGAAQVVCAAVPFDGGLIYLTDKVLLPSA